MFKGSIPALVTPFTQAGAIDEDAFVKHVEWQISEGSHGLVPVGTTGESPTLSHAEHKRVVELCIQVAAKRVPVIAGAGSNNTTEAIELARHAEAAGADALLVVTPYYNRPTQKGLIAHFAAVAHSNIIGVKDATGRLERVSEQRITCGKDFVQLSGEDATALGFNAHGGVGCISVTANVAPRLCADFQKATLAGDFAAALELQDRLMPLHKAIFLEPGVCGAKYALSKLGRLNRTARSPLLSTLEPVTEAAIDAALRHAGLLN